MFHPFHLTNECDSKSKRKQHLVEARHGYMIVSLLQHLSIYLFQPKKPTINPTPLLQEFQPPTFLHAEHDHQSSVLILYNIEENNISSSQSSSSSSLKSMNILQYPNRAQINPITLFSVLLAASAHNRCTSIVCSCYVAARNSDGKDEESIGTCTSRNQYLPSNRERFLEGRICSDKSRTQMIKSRTVGGLSGDSSGSKSNIASNSNEPMHLKSNLKKATTTEINQLRMETRKVSWPDALGKDIAHIQEFEPSVSEDGELESVRNSCVCVIQ